MSLVLVPVSSAGTLTCRVPQDEPTVQAAIDNANCAVIKLGTGTFTENVEAHRSFVLVGKGMDNTFLSGGDVFRTLGIGDDAQEVSIRNLTIADGRANVGGAALFSDSEKLTLKRVRIANSEVNYTGTPEQREGAGMYASGQIKMIDSIVTGNEFQGDEIGLGAGIFVAYQSKLTMTNSLVTKNVGAGGGGIYSVSPVVIRNSTISENTATHQLGGGAGIVINAGKLSVFDSTIKKNTALAPAPRGGGIFVMQNGELSLTRSLVVGNKAPDGGGIYVGEGTATIKDSTIRKNHSAPGFGGGVFVGIKQQSGTQRSSRTPPKMGAAPSRTTVAKHR
ncbi:MAG TPA: right-handed parallel beta-helix repeat-containing protein [Actinomycetota bacterium]|nr:right-handed parallel beta-helix repeat-containing protein [Actinomycetota bacterium]